MTVFQKNTFIHVDLLNKSTSVHKIVPITSLTNQKGVLLNPGEGLQQFEMLQNQPIIHPVNAIKTELEIFYKSISRKLSFSCFVS
jgi:hypothetical protein